jgi:hypothetical protein
MIRSYRGAISKRNLKQERDINIPTQAAPESSYWVDLSGRLSFDFHVPNFGKVTELGAES